MVVVNKKRGWQKSMGGAVNKNRKWQKLQTAVGDKSRWLQRVPSRATVLVSKSASLTGLSVENVARFENCKISMFSFLRILE